MKSNFSILAPKQSSYKARNSQNSKISPTNSLSLTSLYQIEPINTKGKTIKRQARTSGMNSILSQSKLEEKKQAQNSQSKILQQKMQNVSCLYSSFIYKNSQKNFIDDMKLQRYRNLAQNQRAQKDQLLKQVQQIKNKMMISQKQKQTVMFAYRALQTRIRQKQRQVRLKLRSIPGMQQIQINMTHRNQEGQEEMYNAFSFQQQLKRSRQMLNTQGISSLGYNSHLTTSNKLSNNNLPQSQWQQIKLTQIQSQITQANSKITTLQESNKNLIEKIALLQSNAQSFRDKYNRAMFDVSCWEQKAQRHQQVMLRLQGQKGCLQGQLERVRLQFRDRQEQNVRRQIVMKQLEDTNYSYLMREQKEKQDIQSLRKFTENLQLNDDKINQFIQTTFGNQVQTHARSENRLYKEDISYILHLIKKKQNLYNQVIKQYQQKLRQAQTRCFQIEKKLHLTDLLIRKLQTFAQGNIHQDLLSSTNKLEAGICHKMYDKFVQELESLLQTYKLDRRMI